MGFLIKLFILAFISVPSFFGTAYLLIYHLFLIYKDQTTIERVHTKLYIKEEKNEKQTFCERLLNGNDNLLNIYSFDYF